MVNPMDYARVVLRIGNEVTVRGVYWVTIVRPILPRWSCRTCSPAHRLCALELGDAATDAIRVVTVTATTTVGKAMSGEAFAVSALAAEYLHSSWRQHVTSTANLMMEIERQREDVRSVVAGDVIYSSSCFALLRAACSRSRRTCAPWSALTLLQSSWFPLVGSARPLVWNSRLLGGLESLASMPACNLQVVGKRRKNLGGLSTASTR